MYLIIRFREAMNFEQYQRTTTPHNIFCHACMHSIYVSLQHKLCKIVSYEESD